jgi:3-oxoadipate enol-lactonase
MGGMVGQWLGANAPARVDKLILSNTSSYFADKALWEGRLKTVREKGLAAIIDANMERWFTKEFRDRNPRAIARMREMFLATKSEGYIGCGEGIRDMDHRPLLAKINAPTLVIAGKHDPATPLEANEYICQHVPNAQIAVLDAAHIANVEQPQVYADTVLKFLLN